MVGPETAVHPSLLSRLLAILESYSLDRQIVDWCKPKDVRLVERIEGRTRDVELRMSRAPETPLHKRLRAMARIT